MWSHVEDGFIWEPGISSRPSQFYFGFLFVVYFSSRVENGSENITPFSAWWSEEVIHVELSDKDSSEITRSLRISPAQRSQSKQASQRRSGQDALARPGRVWPRVANNGRGAGVAPSAPAFRTLGSTHPAFVSPPGRACHRRAVPPSVSGRPRRAPGREVAWRKRRAAGRQPGRRESHRPLCSGEACEQR